MKLTMKEKFDFKLIFPLIILLIILGGGIFYYQNNSAIDKKDNSNQESGIALGEAAGVQEKDLIADGEIYAAKILEIRKPINEGFESLADKVKYTTLFDSNEIQGIVDNTRNKIKEGTMGKIWLYICTSRIQRM